MGYSLKTMLSWGIPAGLLGGLLAGWFVLWISRAIYNYFLGKGNCRVLPEAISLLLIQFPSHLHQHLFNAVSVWRIGQGTGLCRFVNSLH